MLKKNNFGLKHIKIQNQKKNATENSTLRVPRAVTQVDGLPPALVLLKDWLATNVKNTDAGLSYVSTLTKAVSAQPAKLNCLHVFA